MDYMNTDDYVQSVAASPVNTSLFVYMGENLNRTHHFIGIINVSKSCVSSEIDRHSFIATSSLEGYDQASQRSFFPSFFLLFLECPSSSFFTPKILLFLLFLFFMQIGSQKRRKN
jgi:hypothetical protein